MHAVLLHSGGLDSTVALYWARTQNYRLKCLALDYGQKHRKELQCAQQICHDLSLESRTADLRSLKPFLSGSSQTSDEVEVPQGEYQLENMKITVVPNRNMILLSIAIAWALSSNDRFVIYAAHRGDHSVYPDCRPEFVKAVDQCASLCDWKEVRVLAPFVEKTKTDIVELGAQLNVPFEKTWSCYKGEEIHCGQCGTCIERQKAFRQAKVKDPTSYQKVLP